MRKLLVTVSLLLMLMGGCTQLPEYARPHLNLQPHSELAQRDGFGYRQLTREDFKATSPPANSTEHNSNIRAKTCLNIRPAADTKVTITRGVIQHKEVYVGRLSEVRFESIFLPHCSWWNPQVSEKHADYVLQHEQIHFAIAELEAQILSERFKAELGEAFAFGNSLENLQHELSKILQEYTQEFAQDSLKEHHKFDKDIYIYFSPDVQRKWFEKVESQLREYQ